MWRLRQHVDLDQAYPLAYLTHYTTVHQSLLTHWHRSAHSRYSDQADRRSKGSVARTPGSHVQTLSSLSCMCLSKQKRSESGTKVRLRVREFRLHQMWELVGADAHSWYITAPASTTQPATIATTVHHGNSREPSLSRLAGVGGARAACFVARFLRRSARLLPAQST